MSRRLKKMIRLLGVTDGLLFYWKTKTRRFGKIRARRWKSDFILRPDTTDFSTYQHVFESEEYDIPLTFNPKNIIDGGANIGLSSIYFALRFPKAEIIAIEPDEENFKLLQHNTSVFNNVECRKEGLWNKSGFVHIIDGDADKNAFQVAWSEQENRNAIPAISLGDLKNKLGSETLDIVKLDVEGAEKEIFAEQVDRWLPYTRVLIIETHDRMVPGCSRAVFNAVSRYNFRCEISWENLVFYNEALC